MALILSFLPKQRTALSFERESLSTKIREREKFYQALKQVLREGEKGEKPFLSIQGTRGRKNRLTLSLLGKAEEEISSTTENER